MSIDIRKLLEECIAQAELALKEGNYPIGSIITDQDGKILSSQRNQCASHTDITAHAEILNLRDLSNKAFDKNQKLIMFTSLEPCYGCSFFIDRSPITTIYSALKDPHKGGLSDLRSQPFLNSFFQDIKLINEPFTDLRDQSKQLMREYFLKIGASHKADFYI